MRSLIRLATASIVAALLMAGAATTSAAETLETSEETFIDKTSSLTFTAGTGRVSCPVTLEGTFSAMTFASISGTRVGVIRRATVGTCTGGSARALTETLPWTVAYHSFGGTLPNITSITLDIIGAKFRITESGFNCEARTTEREPLRMIEPRETDLVLTEIRADETISYALTGEGLCGFFTGHISGRGTTEGIVEEGETVANAMAIFLMQNPSIIREELGGPLKKKEIEVGKEGALTITRPRAPGGIPISIRVRFTSISLIEGLPEKFSINFGAMNSCQQGQELPGAGCAIAIRHRGEVAGQRSKIQITYRVGTLRIMPPLLTQEFEVESK
jgi:hypothetical protein